MISSPPPSRLLSSLNVAVLERTEEGSFSLLGEPPPWLHHLWPEAIDERDDLQPQHVFFFLEHFLSQALPLWRESADGSITSEMWTEVDAAGKEWLLEASALQLESRSLLLIKFPNVAPETLREILQQSRELNLEHYQLLKEIDRREVLLHCIVHDLSTPLASIKGSLQLLVDDEMIAEGGASLVGIGQRQVEKMRRMVDELLTGFANSAPPTKILNNHTAPDLADILHDATKSLAPTATLKGVQFRIESDGDEDTRWPVVAEPGRLERVLFNLCENALRHAPSETDVVVRLMDEGATVRVNIEDAGEGVPPQEVTRLFRKFSQGSSTTGKVGLGLYFCRITIEGWGGTIGYTPREEGGACFWFRLPKPPAHS